MKAFRLHRAAAVALAVGAAGVGIGTQKAAAQGQDGGPAPGTRKAATQVKEESAAERRSGMVALRHFSGYQRFHAAPERPSDASGSGTPAGASAAPPAFMCLPDASPAETDGE